VTWTNHELEIPRVHLGKHVVVQFTLPGVLLPSRQAGNVPLVVNDAATKTLEFLSQLFRMHDNSHGWGRDAGSAEA
jgi:hypothetical protein